MLKPKLPGFITSVYANDGYVLSQIVAGILLLSAIFVYLWYQTQGYQDADELVALHYSVYFGIDYLGPWYQLYVVPAISVVIFILHWIFSVVLYKNFKLLAYLLITSSTFVHLVTFGYIFLIIRINR